MKLKQFIEKLKEIKKDHGGDVEVIMADNVSVVDPVFSGEYSGKKNVVVTDVK